MVRLPEGRHGRLIRHPQRRTGEPLAAGLVAATQGRFTNLRGGLPILVQGCLVGAIGVGSGTAEQDLIVAQAGIDALLANLAVAQAG